MNFARIILQDLTFWNTYFLVAHKVDIYIRLRKSLDSIRDVTLAEIELIESEREKIQFANFMTEKVKRWLKEIADKRGDAWLQMNDAQSKKFQEYAEVLLSNPSSACPPGFVEIDGICVRL